MQARLTEVSASVEQAATALQRDYAAEHLYALRVGMRRIRSMLKPLDSTRARRFRKTWGGFAAVTNRARDWDVFLLTAAEILPAELSARFEQSHRDTVRASHEAVLELLESAHWRRNLRDWRQFLEQHGADIKPLATKPTPIDQALSRARAALAAARASGDDRAWHKLRIAVKEVRYQSESCAESADATQRQAELIDWCKPLQALLGGWHDCVVQLQILDDLEPAPEHEALRAAVAKMRVEQLAEIEQAVADHPLFLSPAPGQASSSSRSVSGS
jgi:CHAD domain-containing protein